MSIEEVPWGIGPHRGRGGDGGDVELSAGGINSRVDHDPAGESGDGAGALPSH
jgi:hypothetical protein